MDTLLTKQQLAEMLRISVKTIDLWIAKGYGPSPLKIGRLVRFRVKDVATFINESVMQEKSK